MVDTFNNSLKESLLTVASEKGWRFALERYSCSIPSFRMAYSDDCFRTLWRFLLPLTEKCNVLYIGYDWGVQLEHLARQIGTLTVATADETKIAFLRLVQNQCDLTNLYVVELDDAEFFKRKRATFDILILDGYSEWLDNLESDQIWLQLHALLKEGGCVLCNTDMTNWIHRMPFHLNTRYVVPKDLPPALWFSSKNNLFASISKTTREYLAHWGFEGTRIYLALPHYRDSKVMLPLDTSAVFSYFIKHRISSQKYHIQNPMILRLIRFCGPLWWLIFWCLDRLSPTASIITWKMTP
jgi:hypothetical protein